MLIPRLSALIVVFSFALPGNAAASLIWNIEVAGSHVQGTGQISLSGPNSATSPDFEFDFSGAYSHNPWTLTEIGVTASWLVDPTHEIVSFDLSAELFETDVEGVFVTFDLSGGNGFFTASALCFDTIREGVQGFCHEDDFDFDQTNEVLFTRVIAIPEPSAFWLCILGLGLLAPLWVRKSAPS